MVQLSFSRSLLPWCFIIAEINCKHAMLQPPGRRNTTLKSDGRLGCEHYKAVILVMAV